MLWRNNWEQTSVSESGQTPIIDRIDKIRNGNIYYHAFSDGPVMYSLSPLLSLGVKNVYDKFVGLRCVALCAYLHQSAEETLFGAIDVSVLYVCAWPNMNHGCVRCRTRPW